MKQTKLGLLICLTVFTSQYAAAAGAYGGGGGSSGAGSFYIEETFLPVYVKKNDGQNSGGGSKDSKVATESGMGFDLRTTMGYVWHNMVIGLTYNYYTANTNRPHTADYEGLKTATTKSEYGPTLGYLLGDWRMMFTYFISASKGFRETYTTAGTGDTTTDNNYKNTDGSGFQFAVAYGLALGSGWSIGPTLIYREVTYKKQSLTGTSSSYPASSMTTIPIDSELKPMITVSYRF